MENQDTKYADTNFGTKTSILRILLSVSEVSGPYNQFTFPFAKKQNITLHLLLKIMDIWQPNTVFHAAAYKHVPLVEHNVIEGLRNNVFGTLTVAEAAIQKGVSNFVLISTDKVVHPTSVMGASKRLAELCLQSLYERENCKHAERVKSRGESDDSAGRKCTLSMVRFGNVLDSSG